MKKISLILLLLFLYYSYNIGQNPEWVYFSGGTKVKSFAEEGNYIWIASSAGVVKMDKTTGNKIYYNKTTCPIADNYVNKIIIDNNGTKWFGTENGGLVKYDDVKWYTYDTSNSIIPHQTIKDIAVDLNNNIWIITRFYNSGLVKYNGNTWNFYDTSNSELPDNYIDCIYADENDIWVAFQGALLKFNGSNWTTFNTENSNISLEFTLKIEKDKNGNFWLLHYDGLEKFDGNDFTFFEPANKDIISTNFYSMSISDNNIIWIGCGSTTSGIGGLVSFYDTSWVKYDTANSDISNDGIGEVFVDNSKNVWMSGGSKGLVDMKKDTSWTQFNVSNTTLKNGLIQDILFDNNKNTFIYNGIELMKYDGFIFTQLRYYNFDKSYSFTTDKNGNLFEKSSVGLYKYDGTNWDRISADQLLEPQYLNMGLDAIAIDSTNSIWMDCITDITYDTIFYEPIFHRGLAYYDGDTWTILEDLDTLIPGLSIYNIKVDNYNNIWFGTNRGLLKYDRNNWEIYNKSNSIIPSIYIKYFAIDTSNNIWLSDEYYGLIKFDGINWVNYQHPTLNKYGGYGEIEIDIDGSIWQKTLFDLIHFDGKTWTKINAKNSPLPNRRNLTSLSIDQYGNKWIGTGVGFLVYRENGVKFISDPSSPETDLSILVYPNPFKESIEIKLSKHYDKIEFSVYNLNSKLLFNVINYNTNLIRVSKLNIPAGIYFYQLKSDNIIIYTGKIISN